jgi:hypothetical protein
MDLPADFYVGRPVTALALVAQGANVEVPLSSDVVFAEIAGQKGRGFCSIQHRFTIMATRGNARLMVER